MHPPGILLTVIKQLNYLTLNLFFLLGYHFKEQPKKKRMVLRRDNKKYLVNALHKNVRGIPNLIRTYYF